MNEIALKQIMDTVFKRDGEPIDDDAEVNKIGGWDSLGHIALMLELQKYGCAISNSVMPELTSYTKIKAYIEKLGNVVV